MLTSATDIENLQIRNTSAQRQSSLQPVPVSILDDQENMNEFSSLVQDGKGFTKPGLP